MKNALISWGILGVIIYLGILGCSNKAEPPEVFSMQPPNIKILSDWDPSTDFRYIEVDGVVCLQYSASHKGSVTPFPAKGQIYSIPKDALKMAIKELKTEGQLE